MERTFREVMELSAPEQPLHKLPLDLCQLVSQMDRMGRRSRLSAHDPSGGLRRPGPSASSGATGAMAEQICPSAFQRPPCRRPGGSITVGLQDWSRTSPLFVEDDGCGLPEEAKAGWKNRRRFLGGAQGAAALPPVLPPTGLGAAFCPAARRGPRGVEALLPTRPVPIEATASSLWLSHALQHQPPEPYLLTRKTPLSD